MASGWCCALDKVLCLKTRTGKHGSLLCTRLPLGAPPMNRSDSLFPASLLSLVTDTSFVCWGWVPYRKSFAKLILLTDRCVHTVTRNPSYSLHRGEKKVMEPLWAEAHSFCLTLNVLEQMVFESLFKSAHERSAQQRGNSECWLFIFPHLTFFSNLK